MDADSTNLDLKIKLADAEANAAWFQSLAPLYTQFQTDLANSSRTETLEDLTNSQTRQATLLVASKAYEVGAAQKASTLTQSNSAASNESSRQSVANFNALDLSFAQGDQRLGNAQVKADVAFVTNQASIERAFYADSIEVALGVTDWLGL